MPFKDFQYTAQAPDIGGQAVFCHGDDGKIAPPGDAGNKTVLFAFQLLVKMLPDEGTGVVGGIGIADIKRDIGLTNRENAGFVQHLRTHIAQFAQLVIGNALDGTGIFHNAGVRH